MKRSIIVLIFTVAVIFFSCLYNIEECFAAPVTMPDGTIFDAQFYRISNPDVVAIYGNEDADMYRHYQEYGKKEGRKAYPTNDSVEKEISIKIFNRIGVVGDSFASGTVRDGETLVDNYAISWPQVMGRRYGVTCTNYSRGGLTTKSWLYFPEGSSKMWSSTPDDLYVLALGLNDANGLFLPGGDEYLGNIRDITRYNNKSKYPDTFYGNYGKIIEQIKEHAPGAKIIMVNLIVQTMASDKFNEAIYEIARYYGVPCIDQHADSYFSSDKYLNMDMGHPTKDGYSGMADAFARLIAKCVSDNKYYFYPYVQ